MNYTVISYLPSGDTTCRGCIVESWGSELEIKTTTDRREVVEVMSSALFYNMLYDGEYEITLLLNGVECDNWNHPDILSHFIKKATKRAEAKKQEYEEKKASERIKNEEDARQRQAARDLETLNRLKVQYEGEKS